MSTNVNTRELQEVFGLSRRQATIYHTRYSEPPKGALKSAVKVVRNRCDAIRKEPDNAPRRNAHRKR